MALGLYRYIWSHSASDQVRIVLLTLSSFPFIYVALDLPKHIVNKAIAGHGMGEGVYRYLPADQISHLIALCAIYLCLNLFNGYLQVSHHHSGKPPRRARCNDASGRAVPRAAAASTRTEVGCISRPIRCNDHRRGRSARWLHRRRRGPTGHAGRYAVGLPRLHFRAGAHPRPRHHRSLSGSGLAYSKVAGQDKFPFA